MSRETLQFLRDLLKQVSLNAGDPEFGTLAARIIRARDELDEAIAASGETEAA